MHRCRNPIPGVAVCVVVWWPRRSGRCSPQTAPAPTPGADGDGAQDQVVLSGSVLVPRGMTVGEVVVFHGRAWCWGSRSVTSWCWTARSSMPGQVSGTVVALNGPIRLAATASVRGDVLGAQA